MKVTLPSQEDAGQDAWLPMPSRTAGRPIAGPAMARGFEPEHACWDPKDGELCPSRMKPEETLVEVRSGPDVQIGRQTWV